MDAKEQKVFDASGMTIVPGLIEQHIHPVLSALALTSHVIAIEDWDIAIQAVHKRRNRSYA